MKTISKDGMLGNLPFGGDCNAHINRKLLIPDVCLELGRMLKKTIMASADDHMDVICLLILYISL